VNGLGLEAGRLGHPLGGAAGGCAQQKFDRVANDNLKDDLIRHTRQVWQPRLGRDLSSEDARQIAANLAGFFSVLVEWARAEMPSPANDAGKPDASKKQGGAP
jgi:hypothetical protein